MERRKHCGCSYMTDAKFFNSTGYTELSTLA
jgi:hypothetical protein